MAANHKNGCQVEEKKDLNAIVSELVIILQTVARLYCLKIVSPLDGVKIIRD